MMDWLFNSSDRDFHRNIYNSYAERKGLMMDIASNMNAPLMDFFNPFDERIDPLS